MSSDFSQFLQTNGNGSFTGTNAQQINSGYEAQQHHHNYPWMSSDQQLAPSQTIISGATIATPPTTLNASNVPSTLSKTLYRTPSSETNSNNFMQAQNTPVVGSNVIRKPNVNVKLENNINANINTSVATNGGITVGSNHNKTPEYIDFTQKCVQLILEINYELIRVCIDYQNNGIVNEQDLALYKTRLQINLSYLATVADEYNGNSSSRNEFKQKITFPDLSPLPIPRSAYGQKINALLQRAVQMYTHYKKLNRPSASAITANNNNNSSTIASGHTLDPSSTSSHQFKLGQSPSNIVSMMNSMGYQKQQQQQPTIPPQSQLPQQIPLLKSQQPSSQPQQKQMLQQQTSQQLHQQQNTQQPANRFTNSMISAAAMSTNPMISNATMPMISNATMSTTYQQQHHPTSQHQNLANTNNISEYPMIPSAANSEQSYQVSLPPLARMGNISIESTGVGSGAGNAQGSGILPSLVGMGDQYGMASAQQQQQQQLQQLQNVNVGYTGFIGGGGAAAGINNTGFGTATNALNMMRYPSAGGNGMGNTLASTVLGSGGNGIAGSGLANNMGGGGIGIMGGNNYGSNTIAGNALGMMNHDNGMG